MGVGFIWAVILGVGILLFPETPRYEYRHGKIESAKATLMKVYGAPANHYAIHIELEEIEQKLRAEAAQLGVFQEWYQMVSYSIEQHFTQEWETDQYVSYSHPRCSTASCLAWAYRCFSS